jgi:hypothetical protein
VRSSINLSIHNDTATHSAKVFHYILEMNG